jgi:Mrp family chromosome partitioning ATPase
MMNVPILGVVENMSYVRCPDCGKEIKVFGESHIDSICNTYGLELLGRLPIDPATAKACDSGLIELYEGDYLDKAVEKVEKL